MIATNICHEIILKNNTKYNFSRKLSIVYVYPLLFTQCSFQCVQRRAESLFVELRKRNALLINKLIIYSYNCKTIQNFLLSLTRSTHPCECYTCNQTPCIYDRTLYVMCTAIDSNNCNIRLMSNFIKLIGKLQ